MKNLFILLALVSLACGVQSRLPTEIPTAATKQPLEKTPQIADVINYATDDYFVVCNTEIGLNVRGRPEDEGSVLAVLPPGERVRVREWSKTGNGWAMIARAKWVNGYYLCQQK